MLENPLWLIQIAFSASFLGYAAYKDHKASEVSNNVWLIYFPVASLLTALLPFTLIYLALIFSMTVFSVFLFYFGDNGFGGADAKALICLTVAFPTLSWTMMLIASLSFLVTMLILKANLRSQKPFLPFLFIGFVLVATGWSVLT